MDLTGNENHEARGRLEVDVKMVRWAGTCMTPHVATPMRGMFPPNRFRASPAKGHKLCEQRARVEVLNGSRNYSSHESEFDA